MIKKTLCAPMVIALLISATTQAELDLKNPPKVFCEPSESVGRRALRCSSNKHLVTAAEACFKKLEDLERELGSVAQARAQVAAKNQAIEAGFAKDNYAYSVEALQYLAKVAHTAWSEIDDYLNFVNTPEDFFNEKHEDPEKWSDQQECYGGVNRSLEKIKKGFDDKRARFQQRWAEARKLGSQSGKIENHLSATPGSAILQNEKKANTAAGAEATHSGISKDTRKPKVP